MLSKLEKTHGRWVFPWAPKLLLPQVAVRQTQHPALAIARRRGYEWAGVLPEFSAEENIALPQS